jgi:hypothetical protein
MALWDMFTAQADFDAGNMFTSMFYKQGGRAINSLPG